MISDPGLGTKRGALATEGIPESEIVLKPDMIMSHAATMGQLPLTVGGAQKIELAFKDVVAISAAAGGIEDGSIVRSC